MVLPANVTFSGGVITNATNADIWQTDEGNKDNVIDIGINELNLTNAIWLNLTGGNVTGNVTFDNTELVGMSKIWVGSLSSPSLILTGGDVNSSSSLNLRATSQFRFNVFADTNTVMLFPGTTDTGEFDWMEDEGYFKYFDGQFMNGNQEIYWRDTDINMTSPSDGDLLTQVDESYEVKVGSKQWIINETGFFMIS